MKIRFIAVVVAAAIGFTARVEAQSGPEVSEIWRSVEGRWKAWEAGDLQKMLQSYHPSFHAWNGVSGRLDDNSSLMAGWKAILDVERVDSVKLEPVKVIINGNAATAYYVSRETVARIAKDSAGKQSADKPMVLSSLWSEYLVKSNNRWLTIGYSSIECTESEPEGSACRRK
jgi:hypothetical protein